MKIKVEVDLSDFYNEEEDLSFSEEIKGHIAYKVKQQVYTDWKEKMTTEFTNHVVDEIDKSKTDFVNETLKELAINAKVKKRYSSNEMISVVDYIKEELNRMHFTKDYVNKFIEDKTNSQENYLDKLSSGIVKELKDRYDMLFASQIVSKLNENGMLKDKVAKLILDK